MLCAFVIPLTPGIHGHGSGKLQVDVDMLFAARGLYVLSILLPRQCCLLGRVRLSTFAVTRVACV